MKRTTTKTEFTIEQRQRTTIRLRAPRLVWCELCAAPGWMLEPDEAAVLTATTVRNIFGRIEAGELHFVESDGGVLLVCRTSLELIRQEQEEKND